MIIETTLAAASLAGAAATQKAQQSVVLIAPDTDIQVSLAASAAWDGDTDGSTWPPTGP